VVAYPKRLYEQVEMVSLTEVASYIVFTDGNMCYAKNGRTGQIEFGGVDAKAVIQRTLNALTPGRVWKEKVLVMGNYIIDNSASPLNIPSFTIFELDGRLVALNKKKTLIYVNGSNIELRGGIYDGNRGDEVTTEDEAVRVIQIEDSTDVIVENVKVVNGYSRGIEVDNGYHVTLKDIYAENCWRNVMVWSNSYSTVRNHELRNIHSRNAQGGSGVDLGTVGYVVIDGLYSEGDNPVALAIDSCKGIIARNIVSKFRGIALIFAGYNPTEDITIENATSAGSGAGALLAEVKYIFNINNIVLKNIKVLSPNDTAIVFKRSAGTGVIDNVRIYDIYTDGIPSGKHSVAADNSVQFIEIIGGRVDRPMSIDAVSRRIRDVRGYATENGGVATFSGNGTRTRFEIPHGLAGVPSKVLVTPASAGASGSFYVTADSTYIYVYYSTAPPAGTNNVVLYWYAMV
jgi:hypothetical protein